MARYMLTLTEPFSDKIRKKLEKQGMTLIFNSRLIPEFIGVEAESLEKLNRLPFVKEGSPEPVGRLLLYDAGDFVT